MTLEEMITGYIALRDKKKAMKKDFDAKLAQYTDAMDKIEGVLKGYLNAQNTQSISTKTGTAFLKTTRSATVADKSVFREFVLSNENFDMVDFSPKVEAVEDFFKENEGALPPGVNFTTFEKVGVQRK